MGEESFDEIKIAEVREKPDLFEGGRIEIQRGRLRRQIGTLERLEDVADFAVGMVVFLGTVQMGRSDPGCPQIEQQKRFENNFFNRSTPAV